MREIKFRAWDKINEKMIYSNGEIDYFDGDGIEGGAMETIFLDMWGNVEKYIHTTGGTNEVKMINDAEIMQYTGLKDKNGKEIYEGDILKVELRSKDNYIGRVDFNYGQFWCVKHNGYGGTGYDFDFLCNKDRYSKTAIIEVIGNIFENPELLK